MVEGKSTSHEDITAEVLNEECIPPIPISTPLAPTLPAQTHEPQTPLQPIGAWGGGGGGGVAAALPKFGLLRCFERQEKFGQSKFLREV